MAIYTVSNLISGIRGTVGGTTFSANASGPYVKAWSRSPNPRTASQSQIRAVFSNWAAQWTALAAGERAGWDAYAAAAPQQLTNPLGDTYFATGFNWFIRINTHLTGAGLAVRTAAPTLTRPAATSIASFLFRVSSISPQTSIFFTAPEPTLSLHKAIFLLAVPSTSRSTVSNNRPWMLTDTVVFVNRIQFQDQVEAKYGTIQEGQRAFITIYNQDSQGQRSAPITAAADAQSF